MLDNRQRLREVMMITRTRVDTVQRPRQPLRHQPRRTRITGRNRVLPGIDHVISQPQDIRGNAPVPAVEMLRDQRPRHPRIGNQPMLTPGRLTGGQQGDLRRHRILLRLHAGNQRRHVDLGRRPGHPGDGGRVRTGAHRRRSHLRSSRREILGGIRLVTQGRASVSRATV